MTDLEAPSAKKKKHLKNHSFETGRDKSSGDTQLTYRKKPPKFRLNDVGETASLSCESEERIPITLTDVQHLLLHAQLGEQCPYNTPRWYGIERVTRTNKAVCLVFENVSIEHFTLNRESFKCSHFLFEHQVEVITPSVYGGSLVDELASVPLTDADKEILIKQYGSIETAMESRKDLLLMLKAVFPVTTEYKIPSDIELITNQDKFSRTQLLLSASQLISENYPLPLKGKLKNVYSDYVLTKDKYEPVTSKSPMFGLDCEMCMTDGGSELTRVSIVDENHESIYEALVKPYNKITNYLTRFSGITASMLQNVTKRLSDVQEDIRNLLPPDAILIGQSLNVDLHALKMMHPYVIDTSIIFNLSGLRRHKTKLKVLVREFLNEEIQNAGNLGHCSIEDSKAALKLVQLKLAKGVCFGDAVLENRKSAAKRIKEVVEPQVTSSIFGQFGKEKTSVIIGCEDIIGDYYDFINKVNTSNIFASKRKRNKVSVVTEDTQEKVIDKICELAKEHNFLLSHLKVKSDNVTTDCLKELDEWIAKVYNSLQVADLLLVIFGGTKTANGVALIKIKNTLS